MSRFLLTLALISLALLGWAQAPGGGTVGPIPDPTPVPLDSGASLLLASGVAYGLQRLRRRAA